MPVDGNQGRMVVEKELQLINTKTIGAITTSRITQREVYLLITSKSTTVFGNQTFLMEKVSQNF